MTMDKNLFGEFIAQTYTKIDAFRRFRLLSEFLNDLYFTDKFQGQEAKVALESFCKLQSGKDIFDLAEEDCEFFRKLSSENFLDGLKQSNAKQNLRDL